jgi:adenylate cyclase
VPLLGLTLTPFRETATSDSALFALGLIGILAGLFAVSVAADSIAVRLDAIRGALGRVGAGDISRDLVVDDGGEVGQLQAGFNQMVAGLREGELLQELFGRHVGHEVAAQALERDRVLGGESRPASVMFVDLIGSTAMAEVLPPGEVVATLNAFFDAVVDVVTAEGGWVNKFHGDGALCVFGVPGHEPDHQQRALRAARLLCDRLAELAEEHPGLDAGIGVSSGSVVAGNVGSEERYEYTVIGRAVNQAARLTDLAKDRAGRVLASGAAVSAAGPERANWTSRGRVGLRGQQSPTDVFEPVAPTRRFWDAGRPASEA